MAYKTLVLIVAVLSIIGCTTFNSNENGVRRACKAGISKYSDDTTTFECEPKNIGKANQ